MSATCHDCSCHIAPPCSACVDCGHIDTTCDGDCQTCDCIDRTPPPAPNLEQQEATRAYWEKNRARAAMLESIQYVGRPYSRKEWSYASVHYTIRPEVNGERLPRVVASLIAKHTYFGHRLIGHRLTINVD